VSEGVETAAAETHPAAKTEAKKVRFNAGDAVGGVWAPKTAKSGTGSWGKPSPSSAETPRSSGQPFEWADVVARGREREF